jgi:hypothetical protein
MKAFIIAAVALVSGCATQLEVHSDRDDAQNLSGYRIFAWMVGQPSTSAATST